MAYRRRQGMSRASTFKEEIHRPPPDHHLNKSSNPLLTTSHSFSTPSPADSLAAQAIRASGAHETSSWGGERDFDSPRSKRFNAYEDADNGPKGFWGVLARKAKAILEDDEPSQSQQLGTPTGRRRSEMFDSSNGSQNQQQVEGFRKIDNPAIRKGLDRLSTSLNIIGDSFEKAFEEGRNKTAEILQETRKIQIRRKENGPADAQNLGPNSAYQPGMQTNPETQLKASRDVAMATAAKAKLLLRELKTVKADLAFAKERCSQLEEENRMLWESHEKGEHPTDDDLIRLQLETLLAEKARLAHDNEVYARENRFLREIIEYHQLTMQDVVYLDEGAEEVTEVYPLARVLSGSPLSPKSPPSPSCSDNPPSTKESAIRPQETKDFLQSSNTSIMDVLPSADSSTPNVGGPSITNSEDSKRPSATTNEDTERSSATANAEANRPSVTPNADAKILVPANEDAKRPVTPHEDAKRPPVLL